MSGTRQKDVPAQNPESSEGNIELEEPNVPTQNPDSRNSEFSVASTGKTVYVKNLPGNITHDRVRELFEHHGKITEVVLPPATAGRENRRFGFVYFAEMSGAMKALRETEKYIIDGRKLTCELAKPRADQNSSRAKPPADQRASVAENSQNSVVLPTYPPQPAYAPQPTYPPQPAYASHPTSPPQPAYAPHPAHGTFGDAYGAGYGAVAYVQTATSGFFLTPAGCAMLQMILSERRINVLQQPSLQQLVPMPAFQHRMSDFGNSSGGIHGYYGSSSGWMYVNHGSSSGEMYGNHSSSSGWMYINHGSSSGRMYGNHGSSRGGRYGNRNRGYGRHHSY